ncbi:MAG TPA: 2-dehydropantoate 2-reductase [Chloroflexota bacterium]|nr:2-dehydropantoate 2-reductase [Chloroflexota bacterium]HEX2986842.1 2-dehydropantoate 2-reductase [Chloroflexota bacterium]
MKILVVGPGAMGTLFGGLLVGGGHDVWLLGRRKEVIASIARKGVTVVRGGSRRVFKVQATLNAADAGSVDLVIVLVKAYDTLQACRDALPAVGPETVVLTLQNGIDNVSSLATVFGRERVLAGVTAQAATLMGPGLVRHAGEGSTSLGELDGQESERVKRIAEALRRSGIEVELTESISSQIWGKLVVNAAINPVTALLRVRNGRLLDWPYTRSLMSAVAREVVAVADAQGIALPYDDPVARVETVCKLTASNRSSMLQDVERGVRTEIDQINGAVVKEGEARGIPTPVNWTLTQLVRALSEAIEG